ncbi:UPF0225 protein [Saliniradius amylolyticus]|uniref:UPF0225 protein n=2 Tax=Saliniradius amylolyticus TaxID=2183582 RepID=A0A2S2E328_9ALTE|nr:UPF0225 protein [Saliniradius amylolyticus]
MRSRYSAYASQNYDYILKTYSADQRAGLSAEALEEAAASSQWLALRIEATTSASQNHPEQVQFCAYYREQGQLCQLRETSNFVVEHGEWRYRDGVIAPDSGPVKWPRNQSCFCGSGLKYKRCHAR